MSLAGTHVIVAGAGLAGLSAARDLERDGARVTIAEARDRVGGRIVTIRDGFAGRQHAEGGADLIEGDQQLVRELAKAVGLKPRRILRGGFGFYGPGRGGRRRVHPRPTAFRKAARQLETLLAHYRAAGQRWDSAVGQQIARRSVADWLADAGAPPDVAAGMRGLRNFFLADPEVLSLVALADVFASGKAPGTGEMFRLPQGNDALPRAIAKRLKGELLLGACVRAVRQNADGVRVTVERRDRRDELDADYCIVTLPATMVRDVRFTPALPEPQARAFAALRYGSATRVLLQFASPFWRHRGRPRAFGTDLAIGAVWDGSEGQRGRAAILSLLAGGCASRELRALLDAGGPAAVVRQLDWLGDPSPLVASHVVTWDDDPWVRGGYAYFDPSFDPLLQPWLARPAGRVLFAGEHTSTRWQGYMNGAIESGRRAAAEVRVLAR